MNKYFIFRFVKIFNFKIVLSKIRLLIFTLIKKPQYIFLRNKIFFLYNGQDKEIITPSKYLYAYRDLYEKKEINFLNKKILKLNGAIDVGANIGFYSFFLLNKIVKNQLLYIFEPKIKLNSLIIKNCSPFSNFKIINKKAGIKKNNVTLDSVIKKRVDFIKIDVDGKELHVLKGAKKIIDNYKPKILVEIAEDSFYLHKIHYRDVVNFLIKKRYTCYEINDYPKKFTRTLFKGEVINLYCE
jgi:hypothetical protein